MMWFRVAFTGGVLAYRALFAWLTPWLFVTTMVATPILQISFFGLLGPGISDRPVEVFVVGNALQACALAGVLGMPQMIEGERTFGTVPYLILSPAARSAVYLGRMLPTVINGIIVAVVGLVSGGLVFRAELIGEATSTIALAALAGVFSCTALGVLLGALGLVYRDVFTQGGTVYLLLLLLSGANVPVGELPGWLQPVSLAVPLTRSIDVATTAFTAGTGDSAGEALWGELAVGVIYTCLGYASLRLLERRARTAGRLELL